MLDFRMLGPFEIRDPDAAIPLGPPQQRFVLATLLLESNRMVPVRRLIEMLWQGDAPTSARNALQVHVSRLRRLFRECGHGDVRIDTVGAGYRMVVDQDAVDLHRFQRLVSAARETDRADEAAALLRRALGMWSGQPLADLENSWLRRNVCVALENVWLNACEDLFELELRLGNHGDILLRLGQLVGQHPTRERLAGLLMRTLYERGRRAEAIAVYRRVAHALGDGFGIDPGRSLDDLHLAILRDDRATAASRT
ncbi:MAG TPA: AfsR/SARP family transcriptional regulator [Micromonosporaceae bacterium]